MTQISRLVFSDSHGLKIQLFPERFAFVIPYSCWWYDLFVSLIFFSLIEAENPGFSLIALTGESCQDFPLIFLINDRWEPPACMPSHVGRYLVGVGYGCEKSSSVQSCLVFYSWNKCVIYVHFLKHQTYGGDKRNGTISAC